MIKNKKCLKCTKLPNMPKIPPTKQFIISYKNEKSKNVRREA